MQDSEKSPKSLSGHHHTILSGYIFATKARIDNREKNLLSSNISSTCPHNMVNFGPLAAEIVSLVLGTPGIISTDFASWNCTALYTLVVGVSQTAALNRGRHLYSAGRPSRWALANISSFVYLRPLAYFSHDSNTQTVLCYTALIYIIFKRIWILASLQLGHGVCMVVVICTQPAQRGKGFFTSCARNEISFPRDAIACARYSTSFPQEL